MIRVAALTSSRNDPSSRFRIRQFINPLRSFDIDTTEYRPWLSKYAPAAAQLTGLGLLSRTVAVLAARSYDLTWLNREMVTGRETLERFTGKRLVFDVDDAIWLSNPGFASRIAQRSAGVIAGNEVIARYFEPYARRIWIVPTCIDTDVWQPSSNSPASDTFVVGWSGTRWNLEYLYAIEEPLADFLSDHPAARLLCVCDRPPRFRRLPARRWSFIPWSVHNEVTAVQRMNAGLMPLDDNPWTRAKCALKMLCYMAVGLPVVVSPVGSAVNILHAGVSAPGLAAETPEQWYANLRTLYRDRPLGSSMGNAGRATVIQHYSVRRHAPTLAGIFTEVIQS